MPKGFTVEEQQLIRDALLKEGKTLFGAYGLKKTSIENLTKSVGIGQGSFYIFYKAKEELYYEIFELEEQNFKNSINNYIKKNSPSLSPYNLIKYVIEQIDINPIIKQIYIDNTLEIIIRKLPKSRVILQNRRDSHVLIPLVQNLQSQNLLIDKKPEIIAGLIRSVLMLSHHKKEIGEDIYFDTMNLFTNILISSIVK
jgi:AcrR family transcriptional regulator